jgi:hypothetical protein
MTIEWQYTAGEDFGLLSLAGFLGPEGAHRFTGAIDWVMARGTGPVVVDMTGLRGWSLEGQLAVTEAARRLTEHGRGLELAAIPADGSLRTRRTRPGRRTPAGVADDRRPARLTAGQRPRQA